MDGRGALFREIHKNTWLKRISTDNRKIPVSLKKPERCWVVFCVHDDCEAFLEGYTEPRLAATHSPEWTVPLQSALHISHTLVPTEQEYEFVITLLSDTVRFNASSWEIMQEWVDTLRLKLREMKILSPKENFYSKLPEHRPPLLPTRDPMSPLPATPAVPAALVPGVERVIVSTSLVTNRHINAITQITTVSTTVPPVVTSSTSTSSNSTIAPSPIPMAVVVTAAATVTTATVLTERSNDTSLSVSSSATGSSAIIQSSTVAIPSTSMSNTLSQNLINMLSSPVSAYSSQVSLDTGSSIPDEEQSRDDVSAVVQELTSISIREKKAAETEKSKKTYYNDSVPSLAKKFTENVLADPNTSPSTSGLSSYASPVKRDLSDIRKVENDLDSSSLDSFQSSTCPTPEPIVIPRPQTIKSSNKEKQSKTKSQNKAVLASATIDDQQPSTNITIIQVSSPVHTAKEKFIIPSIEKDFVKDEKYKSNVQIIPSNFTAQPTNSINANEIKTTKLVNETKVTTVQVPPANSYGKISKNFNENNLQATNSTISTSTATIIAATSCSGTTVAVSTNSAANDIRDFGAVTNIPIGVDKDSTISTVQSQHYEQVFVTTSPAPVVSSSLPSSSSSDNRHDPKSPKFNFLCKQQKSASHTELHVNRINLTKPSSSNAAVVLSVAGTSASTVNTTNNSSEIVVNNKSKVVEPKTDTAMPSTNRPLLTRGVTEAVILRPSRRDANPPIRPHGKAQQSKSNNESTASSSHHSTTEQRKRSSSTSDAQGVRSRSNATTNANHSNANTSNELRRMQSPPQPFRPNAENGLHSSGRLTLRETQVLQLRREMMHPGGVRLQLRRKDCVGSIAFVDVFGAVWISGWKQKEHPMLYNALHIGDQLISVANVTVTNANDANKVIRNSASLYIELIIRRVPFGRVYAIRREVDRQCLGLIRDGNTATIVDVVPNSLSARHGLAPKAQSCDGLSLTFWVLTEINGRPLNLFFKDNEVKDRLNAVGRDISILVQPFDLVTKLKKQLKSLRGYKDYIVQ